MTALISLMPASTALKRQKFALRHAGDNLRKRVFPLRGPQRITEVRRSRSICARNGFARTENVLLAGIIVERRRTHSFRERTAAIVFWLRQRSGFEQAHELILCV